MITPMISVAVTATVVVVGGRRRAIASGSGMATAEPSERQGPGGELARCPTAGNLYVCGPRRAPPSTRRRFPHIRALGGRVFGKSGYEGRRVGMPMASLIQRLSRRSGAPVVPLGGSHCRSVKPPPPLGSAARPTATASPPPGASSPTAGSQPGRCPNQGHDQ